MQLLNLMVLMLDLLAHVAHLADHAPVELALQDLVPGGKGDLHVPVVQGVDLMELFICTLDVSYINDSVREKRYVVGEH